MMTAHAPAYDCTQANVTALLTRMKAEFLEMPGLHLTLKQAQRLWTLDRGVCACLLDTLVHEGFLRLRPDGTYGLNTNDW